MGPVRALKDAAAQGRPLALYELGQRFEHGRGVRRDLERAYGLYLLAAERGHAQARQDMERVGRMLEPQARARAGQHAHQWQERR
jgi:TPR repeat protein